MDDPLRDRLRELVRLHGPSVYASPERGAALIDEAAGEQKREAFALKAALQAGVPQNLLSSPRGLSIETVIEGEARRLSEELGLAAEPAGEAVRAWAAALELTDSAAPPKQPGPSPPPVDLERTLEAPHVSLPGAPSSAPFEKTEAAPTAEPDGIADLLERARGELPEVDAEGRNRVEQWLRQAHIHRMRGQWRQAGALCRRALELSPGDATGLELMGDLLAERGELPGALDLYRAAAEREPQRAVLEEKIGRLVVLLEEQERARIVADVLGAEAEKPVNRKRRVQMISLGIALAILGLGIILLMNFLTGLPAGVAAPHSGRTAPRPH